MSGHSKWSTIKHKKATNDAKKGAVYTKLGKNITLATKEGGGDLESNFKLRLAVDLAKASNMPTENIERAIKRGTGELKDAAAIVEVTYEAYAPGGFPMLIDVATDNPNRTVAEVRKVVTGHGGSMGSAGTVSWQFEEVGLVTIRPAKVKKAEQFGKKDEVIEANSEEVELEMMDLSGVRDIQEVDLESEGGKEYKGLEILTERTELAHVHKAIEEKGYIVESAEIVKTAKSKSEVDTSAAEKVDKLTEALEELDDVQNIWDARS